MPDVSSSNPSGPKHIHSAQENIPLVRSPQAPVGPRPLPASAESTGRVAESAEATSPSSESESEGSTMDESSGSSSTDSLSVDQEVSEESSAARAVNAEDSEDTKATDQEGTSCLGSEKLPHPLPERPPVTVTGSHADGPVDSTNQGQEPGAEDSPEPSDASDAYEPPESDPSAAVHYAPFSPARAPADSGDPGRQTDQPHADRGLTGNDQGLDPESRAFLQVGPLDVR